MLFNSSSNEFVCIFRCSECNNLRISFHFEVFSHLRVLEISFNKKSTQMTMSVFHRLEKWYES